MTTPERGPDDVAELRSLLLDTAPAPDPSTSEAMFATTFTAGPGTGDTVTLLPTQDFLDALAPDPDPDDAGHDDTDPSAPELEDPPAEADSDHGDVAGHDDIDDLTQGHSDDGAGNHDNGHDDSGDLGGIG